MQIKFLLPLATLTLMSGCGGSTVSSSNELVNNFIDDLNRGGALFQVNQDVNDERSAIEAIEVATGTGSAFREAAIASGVLAQTLDDIDAIEVGEVAILGAEEEGNPAVAKLAGSAFGGEQLFIITTDEDSSILRLSENIVAMEDNRALVQEQVVDVTRTLALSADIPNSTVNFELYTDEDTKEEETLRDAYELLVYDDAGIDGGNVAVTVQHSRFKTMGISIYDEYLYETQAGNNGSFEAPNGTQTYVGTVFLGTRNNSVQLSGTDLEMSVDFNNSTGTLSASDLVSADGDTGSLEGAFTVINATGSFTGSGIATVNNTSERGSVTGSFDTTADLAGGMFDAGEIAALFAAQKD